MRRGKDRLIGAALCLLLLFGAGCSPAPGADQETLDRELDVQLGLLAEVITQEERSAAMDLWMRLRPVRQARLDRGEYRRGDREPGNWYSGSSKPPGRAGSCWSAASSAGA